MLSIFDLFSIGIGPSSSHTVGPMRAAQLFLEGVSPLTDVHRVEVTLTGSLAFTGKGHGTPKAIILGLMGEAPEAVDADAIPTVLSTLRATGHVCLLGQHDVAFDEQTDIIFDCKNQYDFHPNAMVFVAYHADGSVLHKDVIYSVGGGFIVTADNVSAETVSCDNAYDFDSAAALLKRCHENGLSVAALMMAYEQQLGAVDEVSVMAQCRTILDAMMVSVDRGCQTTGELPGGLKVQRRAPGLYQQYLAMGALSPEHPDCMGWLNVFAMAVSEENAAGRRIVTAPTNGAAGILPAVLQYYRLLCCDSTPQGEIDFLLVAGAVGLLYKRNASISGAEAGCQGEVGVACSMAAAGLAAALGGSPEQIENAAEIGMEHNLGLTCDPVAGLVQIPCIERNAMGAVKAVNAARLALAGDGSHHVTLDAVIRTMAEVGKNMSSIYKETSLGGLAVNVPSC